MKDVFQFLWTKKSFRHIGFAAGLPAFVGYGAGTWNAPFLIRSHEMPITEVGSWLAIISGIGAIGLAPIAIDGADDGATFEEGVGNRLGLGQIAAWIAAQIQHEARDLSARGLAMEASQFGGKIGASVVVSSGVLCIHYCA